MCVYIPEDFYTKYMLPLEGKVNWSLVAREGFRQEALRLREAEDHSEPENTANVSVSGVAPNEATSCTDTSPSVLTDYEGVVFNGFLRNPSYAYELGSSKGENAIPPLILAEFQGRYVIVRGVLGPRFLQVHHIRPVDPQKDQTISPR